jgi:hypothetical protein
MADLSPRVAALEVGAVCRPSPYSEPPPDIGRTVKASENPAAIASGVIVLAVLATLYTMYFAPRRPSGAR